MRLCRLVGEDGGAWRGTGGFWFAAAAGGFGGGGFALGEGLGDGCAVRREVRKQLDLAFGLAQELIAALEMADALLVAREGFGEADLSFFEVVDDGLELREGLLEGAGFKSVWFVVHPVLFIRFRKVAFVQ